MTFLVFLSLLGASMMAGLIAGLFGLGGGAVIVPTVFFLLQSLGVSPELAIAMAVATSMASIVVTNVASLLAHQKLGNINWQVARGWAIPFAAGALLGSSFVVIARTPYLILFFGLFLWSVAVHGAYKKIRKKQPSNVQEASRFVSLKQWCFGVGVGGVSALVGIGGGSLSVPALQHLGFSAHRAIGSSVVLGLLLAIVTTVWMLWMSHGRELDGLPEWTLGLIYLPALLVILPCTLVFAPIGAKLGKRVPSGVLSAAFLGMLALVGGRMVWLGLMG